MTKLRIDKISSIFVEDECAVKTTFTAVSDKNEIYTKVVSHDKSREEFKQLTRTTWSWTTFVCMTEYDSEQLLALGWQYSPRVSVKLLSSDVLYYIDAKVIKTHLEVEISQNVGKKSKKGTFNIFSETPLSDELIKELDITSSVGYKKDV